MSLKKQYLKSKPVCKVTFKLTAKEAQGAQKINLVGDFNDWDQQATQMKRLKDNSFKVVVDLPTDSEYQYKYLLDGKRWENDWKADKYTSSPYGEDNSVVVV
mgnify:FL=1